METPSRPPLSRLRGILDGAVSVALIAASAAVLWLAFVVPPLLIALSEGTGPRKAEELPSEPIPIGDAAAKGAPGARVAVLEYSDFQCPFCGTFARNTLPKVIAQYVRPGRVVFAFRHFPLDAIHAHARTAANAAECGRLQGRFWEVHDALFSSPRLFDNFDPLRLDATGVNHDRFKACLQDGAVEQVDRDITEAQKLGIRGTPTFLFGFLDETGKMLRVTRRESGAIPFDAFSAILDDLLEKGADQVASR